jgi:hypothetical protein
MWRRVVRSDGPFARILFETIRAKGPPDLTIRPYNGLFSTEMLGRRLTVITENE